MASVKDTASFFAHGNCKQFDFCLKLYPDVLRLKAEKRNKKPEELIRLDDWYQNELPKRIKQRGKDAHLVHEELVQTMKWKQSRGKSYPQISYLVKVNTPRAVMQETKKAFRKLPNLEQAITALSNLKGVGTTMASALLAAAAPDSAPFMADECLMAIPELGGIDYTTKEYLNFVQHIQSTVERLNSERDATTSWSPHRVELAVWTHFVASELKPELLEDLPSGSHHPNNSTITTTTTTATGDDATAVATAADDDAPPQTTTTASTTTTTTTNGITNDETDDNNSADVPNNTLTPPPTNDSTTTAALNDATHNTNSLSSLSSGGGGGGGGGLVVDGVPVDATVTNNTIDTTSSSSTASSNSSSTTTTSSSNSNSNSESSLSDVVHVPPVGGGGAIGAGATNATALPLVENSDESNLEPALAPLASNGNNGNGALDSLDESSTRSEDSLEKPITPATIANDETNDSDSLSSTKRSMDCESLDDSSSQPETKKVRSN